MLTYLYNTIFKVEIQRYCEKVVSFKSWPITKKWKKMIFFF